MHSVVTRGCLAGFLYFDWRSIEYDQATADSVDAPACVRFAALFFYGDPKQFELVLRLIAINPAADGRVCLFHTTLLNTEVIGLFQLALKSRP